MARKRLITQLEFGYRIFYLLINEKQRDSFFFDSLLILYASVRYSRAHVYFLCILLLISHAKVKESSLEWIKEEK